jgi:hypothetical protein
MITTVDQFPAPVLAARAEALFASNLSARCEYTQIEVASAIRQAIGAHNGIRGCIGEVAAAYGEHPETAARRMRWARALIADLGDRAESYGGGTGSDSGRNGAATSNDGEAAPRRASLAERGYVHARFGGIPVLVGPELAAQIKAVAHKPPSQS